MTLEEIRSIAGRAITDLTLIDSMEDFLIQFATLVAAAEREACATLVEKNADMCGPNTMLCDVLRGNAAAIRARGESDAS